MGKEFGPENFCSDLKISSLVQIWRKLKPGEVYGNMVISERFNNDFDYMGV